jgi:glycosyltransferase involved in cell wall biosynthesis
VPNAFWLHGPATGKPLVERLARWSPPDLAIANSEFTRGTLRYLYPAAHSAVLHNPVSPLPRTPTPEDRSRLREALGCPPDAVVILMVSRLEPWKGQQELLAALARMKPARDWRCWITAAPQNERERDYLKQLGRSAGNLGVEHRVSFLGEEHEVARLYTSADIFCQPNSGPEAFGIVFIEAMLARLPVVTSALGAAPEVVSTDCGILIPPGNVDELAATLGMLIDDPDRRIELGGSGPARARELTDPGAQLEKLEHILLPLAPGETK